jgi:enolase
MAKITKILAREVLDSRGFPTVEAELHTDSGLVSLAIVPSGASTGSHEALELRDGDPKRFHGKGVLKAVDHVNKVLAPALVGAAVDDFKSNEKKILGLDPSPNKSKLGANAILAVSLALAKASAASQQQSLCVWVQKLYGNTQSKKLRMPVPLMNVINGGAHADNGLDIQEFMIVPHGFSTFREALRAGSETFHALKKLLSKAGLTTAVGDEGGFAPKLKSNREALDYCMQAIDTAGYKAGTHISLALDVAATEFYSNSKYNLKDQTVGSTDSAGLVDYYAKLATEFPLISIEDGCSEDDWAGWAQLTQKLGSKLQLVGDDLFVTQSPRLMRGIDQKIANAILIKLNQVGSLSETLDTMKLASEHAYKSVVSHRSGESEDTTLSHLAVGTACGQVKTGSLCRSERVAKYNELLRIEERESAEFVGLKL